MLKAVIVDIWKTKYKKLDEVNVDSRRKLEVLELERQKVFNHHRAGTYTDDDFIQQKSLINRQIDAENQLLMERRVEEFNMEEALEYCFNFVRNVGDKWIAMENDYASRIRFQNLILKEKLEFDGEKFGTPKLSLIFAIKKTHHMDEPSLVTPRGVEPRLQA